MECVNTYYLNKHLENQERKEKELELLIDYIQDDIDNINSILRNIRAVSKDWDNYDFEEDINDYLKEVIL